MAGGHAPKRRRTVEVISDSSEDEGVQLCGEGDELARAQSTLSKVENGLLCGICMELLDRPCVYVFCAHAVSRRAAIFFVPTASYLGSRWKCM